MNSNDRLSLVDPNILHGVALSLPVRDLHNLCLSSKTLSNICNDERFWKRRFAEDFPQSKLDSTPNAQEQYFVRALLGLAPAPNGRLPFVKKSVDDLMKQVGIFPVDAFPFVYPSPLFAVTGRAEECSIKADLIVASYQDNDFNYCIVSQSNRRPLFDTLPAVATTIESVDTDNGVASLRPVTSNGNGNGDDRNMAALQSLTMSKTYAYPNHRVFEGIYLPQIFQSILDEGYLPSTSDQVNIPISCVDRNNNMLFETAVTTTTLKKK